MECRRSLATHSGAFPLSSHAETGPQYPRRGPVCLADGPLELIEPYEAMGGHGSVPLQEYVPSEDSDIWMFTGHFDEDALYRFGATARKIRQLPPRMGICSAEVCQQNPIVLDLAKRFMSAIGYRGLVDIDLCWDRRDGTYKLLDVNPRLLGAFRLTTDRDILDVVWAIYLDFRGLPCHGPTSEKVGSG